MSFFWGGGRGGLLWGVVGRLPPPPGCLQQCCDFAMKNLQPTHVPYCGTSPVKQAAFRARIRGAAASGADQIIITHFYIIIVG